MENKRFRVKHAQLIGSDVISQPGVTRHSAPHSSQPGVPEPPDWNEADNAAVTVVAPASLPLSTYLHPSTLQLPPRLRLSPTACF